jgi:hypothetical protein
VLVARMSGSRRVEGALETFGLRCQTGLMTQWMLTIMMGCRLDSVADLRMYRKRYLDARPECNAILLLQLLFLGEEVSSTNPSKNNSVQKFQPRERNMLDAFDIYPP